MPLQGGNKAFRIPIERDQNEPICSQSPIWMINIMVYHISCLFVATLIRLNAVLSHFICSQFTLLTMA